MDVVDAIANNLTLMNFLIQMLSKLRRILTFDDSLLINRFVGNAPEQKVSYMNTLPLAVPIIFSITGDSGKGMMTLDFAMKVSSGQSMQESFGGMISEFGNSIIRREDDEDEMHRRIDRLDIDGSRSSYEHELRTSLPMLVVCFRYYKKHMMDTEQVMNLIKYMSKYYMKI